MKHLVIRFLSLFLAFQIVSFSVLPGYALAQEGEESDPAPFQEEVVSEDPAPESEPEPAPEQEAPSEEEPQSDDSSSGDQPAFEEYVEEAPPAETQDPEVPQEESLAEQPAASEDPADATPDTSGDPEPAPEEQQSPESQVASEAEQVAATVVTPEEAEQFLENILENPINNTPSQEQTVAEYTEVANAIAHQGDDTTQEAREGQEEPNALNQASAITEEVPGTFIQVAGAFYSQTEDAANALTDGVSGVANGAYAGQIENQSAEYQDLLQAEELARQKEVEEALAAQEGFNTVQISQALKLSADAPQEQIIAAINDELTNAGVQLESAPGGFLLTTTDDLLPDAETLKSLPPEERRNLLAQAKELSVPVTEFVLDVATQGGYLWAKEQEARDAANKQDIESLDKLREGTGFSPPYGIVDPEQEREFFRLQRLTQSEIDAEVARLQEQDNLYQSVEAQTFLKRIEYARAIADYDVRQMQRIDDSMQSATAFVALNLAAGPVFDEGLKRLAQVGKPVLQRAKDFVGGLFNRGAQNVASNTVEGAIKNLEPVYAQVLAPETSTAFGARVDLGYPPLTPLENRPLEVVEKTDEVWKKTFGGYGVTFPSDVADKQKQVIADWVAAGVDEERIQRAFQKAQYADYHLRLTQDMSKVPPDVKAIFTNLRYDSRLQHDYSEFGLNIVDLADSILVQEGTQIATKPTIDESLEVLVALRRYATDNGADKASFGAIQNAINPEQMHIVPQTKMNALMGNTNSAGGFILTDQQIVLLPGLHNRVSVITHECIHKACHLTRLDPNATISTLVEELGGGQQGLDNYVKITEGLTEWTNLKGLQLAGKEQDLVSGYGAQVNAVEKIVLKLQEGGLIFDRGLPREQAEALVIEAAMSGYYGKLWGPLGKGDAQKGKAIMRQILDETPTTTTNVVEGSLPQPVTDRIVVLTPKDKALAVAGGTAVVATGGAVGKGVHDYFQNVEIESNSEPFHLIKQAKAQVKVLPEATPYELNSFQTKATAIKDALKRGGVIDKQFAVDVAKTDIFESSVAQLGDSYSLTTGSTGLVKSPIDQGTYLISVNSFRGTEVSIPQTAEIKNGKYVVPVGIRAGDGSVQRIGKIEDSGITVFAADEDQTNEVAVVTYSDVNGNGKWDGGEDVLPWAGVEVQLQKVNQNQIVKLQAGWNLVTLNAVPSTPLTASSLLAQIAKQGGYATTVSALEDGVWKSYVVRGDNNFSGEDFAIEPGKAYFVKTVKKSLLAFEGQELAAPVKLSLEEGWNAIGAPKTSVEYSVSGLLEKASRDGVIADAASRWESGLWDSFITQNREKYGEDFKIEPNRGYIIRVNKESELTP